MSLRGASDVPRLRRRALCLAPAAAVGCLLEQHRRRKHEQFELQEAVGVTLPAILATLLFLPFIIGSAVGRGLDLPGGALPCASLISWRCSWPSWGAWKWTNVPSGACVAWNRQKWGRKTPAKLGFICHGACLQVGFCRIAVPGWGLYNGQAGSCKSAASGMLDG